MDKNRKILVIVLILLLIITILGFLFLWSYLGHKWTDLKKKSYGTFMTAIDSTQLKQDKKFYYLHKDTTSKYLQAVYPLGAYKIKKMSFEELAIMYNSLTLYYNCCYKQEYNQDFPTRIPLLDKNCCSNSPLPYIPQGWLYDMPALKKGKAIVYSDGQKVDGIQRDVKSLISQTPQVPWQQGAYGCGEGPNCGDNCMWNIDQPFSYFLPSSSGPGPFWVMGYTILRAYYAPHGPDNNKKISEGSYNLTGWTCKEDQTDDDYLYPSSGSLPKTWWKGKKEKEFIEVTHSDISPGMAESQGFWMNGFPSGGTGIFYQIGKTKISKNKLAMLFNLLSELKNKSADELQLPDLTNISMQVPSDFKKNYSNMNGSDFLKQFYNTDDPYLICWKYIAGNRKIEWSDEWDSNSEGIPDPSGKNTNKIWGPRAITSSSTENKPAYLVIPANWYWLDNGSGVLGVSGLLNPNGKGATWLKTGCKVMGSDGMMDNFDVSNFGKSYPFPTNHTTSFLDVLKYKLGIGTNDFPNWQQCKKAIDDACMNKNYYLSRVCVIVSLDEPILWCSRVLGYQTLQQPQSANSNGYFQWEVIDTTIPNKNWVDMAKGRIYPFMQGSDDTPSPPSYTQDGLNKWMDLMGSLISIRDPFDVNNTKKASYSKLGSINLGTKTVGTCDPGFTYNANGRNECASGGMWNCCKDAKKFLGNEISGYFDSSTGNCYPEWNNIYNKDNISNYYGQISIFNGINNTCSKSGNDNNPTACLPNPTCINNTINESSGFYTSTSSHFKQDVNNEKNNYNIRQKSLKKLRGPRTTPTIQAPINLK